MLSQAAQLLASASRRPVPLVISDTSTDDRFALGSRFARLVVLAALTTSNDAVVVTVRLLLALAEPFDVVGNARTLHCSIGVAEAPRDAQDASALLGAALGVADRAQVLGGGRYSLASERNAPC